MPTEISIDTLTYGRAGLGRVDGRAVFVERTAPGDRVRVDITREHGRYSEADLVEIIEPGLSRVPTPCPVAGECGGCPWQHVDYETQLAAKQAAVVDAIERIAGIAAPDVAPAIAAPEPFEYRNRIKLRFDRGKLGYYRARTHSLVGITDCMLGEASVRSALPAAEAFVAGLDTRATRVEVASTGEGDGVVLAVNSQGRLRRGDSAKARELVESEANPFAGVFLWGRGWSRRWGNTRRRMVVDDAGTWVWVEAGSFGQVNTTANRLLVSVVQDMAAEHGNETVLELYAGAGNLSLPLSRRVKRVIAVEADEAAVEAGIDAARAQRLRGVRFTRADSERYLEKTYRPPRPDVVLVDPPRSGLGRAVGRVAAVGAPRLLYVSCNPATLARDIQALAETGYQLDRAQPLDLFPQTFHVETVCSLRLT